MYMSGFMPKRMALMKEVNEELWKDQEAMKTKINTYGRIWAEAETEGDFDMLTNLQMRALSEGVPLDSVIRSAKTQKTNAEKDTLSRKYKPEDALRFQSLGIIE
jgi:hypothetical protein